MLTIVLGISLAGYWLAAWRWLRWPIEAIPLTVVTASIDVLYLAGLLRVLWPVACAVVTIGMIAFVVVLASTGKERLHVRQLSPGGMAFVILILAIGLRLQGAAFSGWDELASWGPASRAIIEADALIGRDTNVPLKTYPPGTALFHYFTSLDGHYSETRLYVAHALLAVAALTALFTGASWGAVLLTSVFGYFGLYAFAHGLETIDVDHLVALLFGCGLGSYYLSSDEDRIVRLVPVAMALVLLKSVGLLLAIFMVLTIAADQIVARTWGRRRSVEILVLGSAIVLTSWSWSRHVETLVAPPPTGMSVTAVRTSFSGTHATERDRTTIARFRAALVSTPVTPGRGEAIGIGPGGSVVACSVVLLLFWAALVFGQSDAASRTRAASCFLWLALCGLVYGFGLLLLYLYTFSEYEGTRLASFGRYFGIYFFGAACVAMAWALLAWRAPARRAGILSRAPAIGLAAWMVWGASLEAARFVRMGPLGMTAQRRYIQDVMQPVIEKTGDHSRIYQVWQRSTGFEPSVGRYELSPRATNPACWSLGPPHFEGDIWSCSLTADEWAAQLRTYDYVVLGYVDEGFWDRFAPLFRGSRQGTFFRVEKNPTVQLVAERRTRPH